MKPPARHWRSYGDDKLPTGREALDEPFAAFPSWFMRITCDRCGKDRMLNEARVLAGNITIRAIIAKMRRSFYRGTIALSFDVRRSRLR